MGAQESTPTHGSERSRGARLGRYDLVVALLLCAGTVATLSTTAVMGFTRDESFYFRYAETYQGWFERVLAYEGEPAPEGAPVHAGDAPLDKRDTLRTWRENFEHPPLMKALFGWSWRLFAWKARPIELGRGAEQPTLRVSGLTEGTGFSVGDRVTLHPPIPVGAWSDRDLGVPVPPAFPEAFGEAVVRERDAHHATLEVVAGDPVTVCATPPATGPPTIVMGCSARTGGVLQVLPEHQAMRLPTWLFTGILLGALYLFGAELFGRRAGLFAALAFLVVPRHYFHAHLCTFDMPVTAVIVLTVYAFWRSLRSRVWVYVAAVLWGVSLLTKLNGYFIPLPLVAAWLGPWLVASVPGALRALPGRLRAWRGALFTRTTGIAALGIALAAGLFATGHKAFGLAAALLCFSRLRVELKLPPMPRAFIWMLAIGLPMQFILWPQMWFDPAQNFASYVTFHVSHVHYPQEYFGDLLNVPPFPWVYPFVMTALTVPGPILLIMLLGCVLMFATHRREVPLFERLLLLGNLLLPIGLIALPSTPIFGGVKHWMATLAFGALIGGFAFDWLCRSTLDRWLATTWRPAVAAALMALVLASGAAASVRSVAFGTGYYNELIGGVRGAADARMMRKYWGFAAAYALDVVNQKAPRGASVAFHEATWDAFEWYQRLGWLRSDLQWRRNPSSACRPGDVMLFHHQGPMAEDEIATRRFFDTVAPVVEVGLDGVPMLSVYACREPGR